MIFQLFDKRENERKEKLKYFSSSCLVSKGKENKRI